MESERRIYSAPMELRKGVADKSAACLRGYAARFNSLSENLGGFREQIASGAFDDVLTNDVRCFFNHDPNQILGRTLSGTCRIGQDSQGLWYEVDLPDTQAARDLMVAVDRGDVSQSSFGFRVAPGGDTWDENDDGVIIRTISKMARLFDVSPVSIPAYPEASVGMRSLDAWKSSKTADQVRAAAEVDRRTQARRRALTLLS